MPLPASAFPLSVSGAEITRADTSAPVRLAGVNWGGAYQDFGVPSGLRERPRAEIIGWIVSKGFNHVRFPFSTGTFVTNSGTLRTAPADPSRLAANPDLQGLSPWEIYCQLVEDMTAAGLYVVANKHLSYPGWPVPQSTEILTQDGWKTWDEVEPGTDQALGRADDGTLQWTPVLQVRSRKAQPVVRIGTKRWSTVCTPDHRWLVQEAFPRNDKPVEWGPVQAEAAWTAWNSKRTPRGIAGARRLVLTGYAEGGKSECTPDEARLVAWILGDGNLIVRNDGTTYQAYIAQSPRKHATEIRNLVTRTGFLRSETTRQSGHGHEVRLFRLRNVLVKALWQAYLKDGLLSFVLALSQEARAAWLDAWQKAEGSAETIYQNPGDCQEAIALTAFLEGYLPQRVNGKRHKGVTLGTRWVSNSPACKWIYENAGQANVWCPTTGLGSWVARDAEGRIFLTGNCCSEQDLNGLWYNDNWPSSTFTNMWTMVATRFAANPLVGFDLHNEPRRASVGGAVRTPTWGTNGNGSFPTDFRQMYQNTAGRIRSAVSGAGSDIRHLVFCEGLSYAGDLTGWGANPVTGDNIVASVHDYPWFHQHADKSPQTWAEYSAQNESKFGYLETQGRAPVWIGECGSNTDASRQDFSHGWFPNFLKWAQQKNSHWCVPLSVQILTRTGWKNHGEVQAGIDETLGYKDGKLAWCKITDVQTLRDQPIIRFGTRHHWQTESTPDHRWLCQVRQGRAGIWSAPAFTPAAEAWKPGHRRIILAAPAEGGVSTCSPDEAALVAWLLGDGSIYWKNGCPNPAIYQKNYPDEVRDLLIRLTALVSEKTGKNGTIRFQVRASVVRKLWDAHPIRENLLAFVLSLSEEARAAWLHAWHRAEGDRSKAHLTIYQNPGPNADAIVLSVFLSGARATVNKKDSWRDVLVITAGKPVVSPERSRIYEQRPNSDVWCPSTELKSWVARDAEGRIYLTGNCWWTLNATEQQGTEPGTNTVKTEDGQGEGFGLLHGQDWRGEQSDTLAALSSIMPAMPG